MVYHCPSVCPFHMSRSNLRTPWPDSLQISQSYWNWWSYSLYTLVKFRIFIPELWDFIHQIVKAIFRMSHCKLRTPWPIHFKLRIVIGIDSLMVCILFGEISIFHSSVMGLYSSNCRRFFVCCAVNWEPLGQFISNFAQLLELIVLRSVYFLMKFRFFHSRVMGLYSSNCRRFFVCRAVNWEPLGQFTSSFALLLELIVFTDFSKNVVFNCINIV